MATGIFVVIDGTDGVGKNEQATRLVRRLGAEGLRVEHISFPRYDSEASYAVRRYLGRGMLPAYGGLDQIDARVASTFYALDRYDASFEMRRLLDTGSILVSDRYVTANMGHQGGKISDPMKRREFFQWLDELEHTFYGIPRPTVNLILDATPEVSQQRMEDRGEAKDLHEANPEHLRLAREVYLEICQLFPEQCRLIDCTPDGRQLSRAEVHELIWSIVRPLIQET